MRLRINFLKRITAMLLSGMLVIGLASGSVFASAIDIDPSQTSEVAEEAQAVEVAAEAFEAPENPNQTSEISEESLAEEEVFEAFEAPENSGQTSEISEESLAEEEAIEASEAPEIPARPPRFRRRSWQKKRQLKLIRKLARYHLTHLQQAVKQNPTKLLLPLTKLRSSTKFLSSTKLLPAMMIRPTTKLRPAMKLRSSMKLRAEEQSPTRGLLSPSRRL